jgi:hypothetical protein
MPAAWNKYDDVIGDQVNLFDPTGRDFCDPGDPDYPDCDDPCTELAGASPPDSCGDPGGGGGPQPQPPAPAQPSCEDQLVDTVSSFLQLNYPSLAGYASVIEVVGASDDIDPRFIAAIAVGENGQAKNNPFGLGGNGSSSFPSLTAAISAVGNFLNKAIYQWKESTISALWSGNGYKTVPGKPWMVIQYPAYCYGGANGSNTAACQATGKTISGLLQSIGGKPDALRFPCPN